MSRKAEIVVLCEDKQHAVFARRFLKRQGYKTPPRIRQASGGQGSAEQWVRNQFVKEVQAHRTASPPGSMLVVIIDDDTRDRRAELKRACNQKRVPYRLAGDRIGVFVPARNIEAWLAYLNGDTVDEQKRYPKFTRQKNCYPHVKVLREMCQEGRLREPAPESLREACDEFARITGA